VSLRERRVDRPAITTFGKEEEKKNKVGDCNDKALGWKINRRTHKRIYTRAIGRES
jgi:hypothetical protein